MTGEFFAFGQKLGKNQRAERSPLCPVFGLVSALGSLSSVALSSARVSRLYHGKKGAVSFGNIITWLNDPPSVTLSLELTRYVVIAKVQGILH